MFMIRPLIADDTGALSEMLNRQTADYIQYFHPFDFDVNTISRILKGIRQDLFFGIFYEQALIGFFMLRGWDENYEIPAYGVVIDERFHGNGLGALTMDVSKSICKLRGVRRILLKVHPENLPAKHLYETAGFVNEGIDPKNGHWIYYFNII